MLFHIFNIISYYPNISLHYGSEQCCKNLIQCRFCEIIRTWNLFVLEVGHLQLKQLPGPWVGVVWWSPAFAHVTFDCHCCIALDGSWACHHWIQKASYDWQMIGLWTFLGKHLQYRRSGRHRPQNRQCCYQGCWRRHTPYCFCLRYSGSTWSCLRQTRTLILVRGINHASAVLFHNQTAVTLKWTRMKLNVHEQNMTVRRKEITQNLTEEEKTDQTI